MSDLIDLIHATVRLEQVEADGSGAVGTGFVVVAPGANGEPRTILITAEHVFERMPRDKVKVGFRAADEEGGWRYAPVGIRIRDAEGDPLWTAHPVQDIAAIPLPSGIARVAVPATRLATSQNLAAFAVAPGDEMMVLGYPRGFSANAAGFPVLRAGRVASYPFAPPSRYPTFLLDFSVFAGNSGGPVYIIRSVNGRAPRLTVTGIVTQELRLKHDRLEIGNVTHATYIAETLALMDHASPAEVSATDGVLPLADPKPAASGPDPSALDRLREGWDDVVTDVAVLFRRAWIVVKQSALAWITSPPGRA
jgi:V8-like Glu-specific endopeptidase